MLRNNRFCSGSQGEESELVGSNGASCHVPERGSGGRAPGCPETSPELVSSRRTRRSTRAAGATLHSWTSPRSASTEVQAVRTLDLTILR
jgi:hypothetical protein